MQLLLLCVFTHGSLFDTSNPIWARGESKLPSATWVTFLSNPQYSLVPSAQHTPTESYCVLGAGLGAG